MELSWGMLEHLGDMLRHLGAMMTHLGPMLGHLGGYVGASWGCLEPCWSHVAAKLVPRGAKQQKLKKNEIVAPPDLTGPWRGMGSCRPCVFSDFLAK